MFQETIVQIQNGATLEELSEQLRTVVAAVRDTGKPGTLTLSLKVVPASKGSTEVLMIESQVKSKLPERERGRTVFFATDDNQLVRNDPRQQMLPLRVIDFKSPETEELQEAINK